MKNIFSIFFNNDRVYTALVTPGEEALEVKYLNATINRIDPEYPDSEESQEGLKELEEIYRDIEQDVDTISATVPAGSVLMTQFPGEADIKEDDLKKLLDFEIRNSFPKFDYKNFTSKVIPLKSNKRSKDMMIASIIPNDIHVTMKDISKLLGKNISNINISQFNAHSSYFYNYPDKENDFTALVNIQGQFIDVSILQDRQLIYYNLLSINDNFEINDKWKEELNRITSEIVDKVDTVCLMGEGLTKVVMEDLRSINNFFKIETIRFNTFRMLKANMSEAEKDFAIRALHIFPPCIGGAIPPYYKEINLL